MSPTKKHKPTFDVARDPIGNLKSGWVYRSEPADRSEPFPTDEPPVPRKLSEQREPVEPHVPSPPMPGWLSTGLLLMVLPVTLGVTMMIAPVSWMLSGRNR